MRSIILFTILITAVLAGAQPAGADDRAMSVTDPLVRKECGSCHMAFQPAFLPARSWNRMIDQLADHFGEKIVLPADKTQAIRHYLTANAGDVVTRGVARKFMAAIDPGSSPQQITSNPAFAREHRFPDKVWKDPKVVTKSNCLACHAGADGGNYDDD